MSDAPDKDTPADSNPSSGGEPADPPREEEAPATTTTEADADDGDADADDDDDEPKSRDDRIAEETELVKSKKVGELKKDLAARGIATVTFVEKSEFVRALAEARVDGVTAPVVETVGEGDSSDDEDGGDDNSDDDDDDPDMMDVLPPAVALRVEALRTLHSQRDEIMETYLKERAALEAKFAEQCKPLYAKRREIVAGERDDEIRTAAASAGGETEKGENDETKEDDKDKEKDKDKEDGEAAPRPAFDLGAAAAGDDDDDDDENLKGIPQFWVCAIGHMEVVAELIAERDVDCLEHLTDVTCEDYESGEGFVLRFHFSENDYFTNDVLTKRYEIPNLLLEDEPILKDVIGCDIDWKADRSLTYREVKKKQRAKGGRRAGQVRTVTKRERTESFFHFFSPPKLPSMEDMDEEQADRIEHAFDVDYDAAQAFRGHIVPKAVLWFTGEAMDDGMEQLLDEEGMPVEEEEGGAAAGGANGPSPFPAPAAGGGENPECQQS